MGVAHTNPRTSGQPEEQDLGGEDGRHLLFSDLIWIMLVLFAATVLAADLPRFEAFSGSKLSEDVRMQGPPCPFLAR
jgi:hypothetical protein